MNIQNAVGVAAPGDVVNVTNGGGVSVTNPLMLVSLNGPQFTVIDGYRTHHCISLSDGASLTGFTLTQGAGTNGGGAWCASSNVFVTNCTLIGNGAGLGGGVYGGTFA